MNLVSINIINEVYFQEMFKSLIREDESATNSNVQLKKEGGQRQFSEEKNKFALSVLRRVRVKLEGREPDSLRKVGDHCAELNAF